jgi:hypothetical protein
MMLTLYYAEEIKQFLVGTAKATDHFREDDKKRFPNGVKKLYLFRETRFSGFVVAQLVAEWDGRALPMNVQRFPANFG